MVRTTTPLAPSFLVGWNSNANATSRLEMMRDTTAPNAFSVTQKSSQGITRRREFKVTMFQLPLLWNERRVCFFTLITCTIPYHRTRVSWESSVTRRHNILPSGTVNCMRCIWAWDHGCVLRNCLRISVENRVYRLWYGEKREERLGIYRKSSGISSDMPAPYFHSPGYPGIQQYRPQLLVELGQLRVFTVL